MSLLYQSSLRRAINEHIYKKAIIELSYGAQSYRGTIKSHRILGKQRHWSMVHGVDVSAFTHYDASFHSVLQSYKRDHARGRDIFLQLGSNYSLASYATAHRTTHEGETIKKIAHLQRDLLTRYDLRPTVREHMPHATIVLDTKGTMEDYIRVCSDNGKRMINKGKKAALNFSVATTQDERKDFWTLWYATSYDKGFSILPEEQFLALMDYVTAGHTGRLFLAKKEGRIVSGSLCLQVEQQLIYLYGATDRAFGAIGAHYRLTLHILAWARDHHMDQFDLLGIAPPGADTTHSLAGVTRFKQSFGGKTIVYAGSYDLPCSVLGYQAFKVRRAMK